MRIITHTCPSCGTILAANELEAERVEKCPGLDCDAIVRFEDIPAADREYFLDNVEQYHM